MSPTYRKIGFQHIPGVVRSGCTWPLQASIQADVTTTDGTATAIDFQPPPNFPTQLTAAMMPRVWIERNAGDNGWKILVHPDADEPVAIINTMDGAGIERCSVWVDGGAEVSRDLNN